VQLWTICCPIAVSFPKREASPDGPRSMVGASKETARPNAWPQKAASHCRVRLVETEQHRNVCPVCCQQHGMHRETRLDTIELEGTSQMHRQAHFSGNAACQAVTLHRSTFPRIAARRKGRIRGGQSAGAGAGAGARWQRVAPAFRKQPSAND
jgi:hypothetical protein